MKRNAPAPRAAVVAKAGSESGAVSAGGGSFDSACTDSTTWHKKGDDKKNCAWVGKKKVNRCAWVKSEDGVLASVACPVACDTCLLICEEAKQDLEETLAEEKQTCAEEKQTCAEEKQTCAEEKQTCARRRPARGPSCVDSTTWHQGWKKSKTCAWVGKSPAKRCDKESKSKVLASDACPVACDACPTWAEVIAELEAANAALEGKYFDGCTECPNGYTCDGVTKTCAVNKYVDNNECLECPASATCDGVNAVCDDVNKYVDNNECLECPASATCDGVDATYSPTDEIELKAAAWDWIDDATSAEAKYGHISEWDTSKVTDMHELFYGAPSTRTSAPGTCRR
ncbi:cupin-like domain-containing protein [Aureococcus anophagefferens]|nr:cupin-like domain-containing protein [Aureococcus anophagefferens]